ncbi:MAG: thiamine phosphate synthase [Clostridiales bacterium]|nr:thiamine phosphate synthase [Clostridiales bacterium]
MIIFMSDIICVTNRSLCKEDFLQRVEKIAAANPAAIILREKDLTKEEYKKLAKQVLQICEKYQVPCILHSFTDVAIELSTEAIHLPLLILREMTEEQKSRFKVLGASCHSLEEALEAERLGCTYIIAGHIFATDCKKGLPGRGLDFLKSICGNVSIPVYAIGGIDSSKIETVRNAEAKGACIMSGFMQCEDVETYLNGFALGS